MFRIVCFVDDRKLADFYHGINGRVLSVEAPQPVANASAKGGRIAAETSGDCLELLVAFVKKKKLKVLTPRILKEFTVGIGLSEGSYSNVLRKAVAAGFLVPKGKGKQTAYHVKGGK